MKHLIISESKTSNSFKITFAAIKVKLRIPPYVQGLHYKQHYSKTLKLSFKKIKCNINKSVGRSNQNGGRGLSMFLETETCELSFRG